MITHKPSKFTPARDVYGVQILPQAPPFIRSQGRKSGRRWAGVRYEQRAHSHFEGVFGDSYVRGPWIAFNDGPSGARRYCQPDALIVEPRRGRITVFEIKHTHTDLAYWQLFHLYIPVLQGLFPAHLWHFAGVEVCARFDCAVACAQPPLLRRDVRDALPLCFNVHIWRP